MTNPSNLTRLPRMSRLLAPGLMAAALLAAPAAAEVLPATISVSQDVLEMGQSFTFTVNGPADAHMFLLIDFEQGQTQHPKLGTIDIAFSPLLAVFDLGTMPSDGLFVRFDQVSCFAGLGEVTAYFQVLGRVPGTGDFVKSNPLDIVIVEGDCADECSGGVVVVGLRNTFAGVTDPLQQLDIELRDKKANGALVASFSMLLDASSPPTMPLTNATGSVLLQECELVDGDLTIRFRSDATFEGLARHKNNTYFIVRFGGQSAEQLIHLSCSEPIGVGYWFDEFLVTDLIDKD